MGTTFYIQTAIFVSTAFINTLLALAVYRNNPRSATNQVYGLLSLVIILWMAMNYLSLLPALLGVSLVFIRMSIFFATSMSALFLLFAHTIPRSSLRVAPRRLIGFSVVTIATMAVTLSPLAFSGITITNNSPNPVPGPGIGLFSVVSTAFSVMAIYILLRKFHTLAGRDREQLRSVLYGIGIMLGLIIVTVLVPVVLFKFNFFVSFIPLYTLIFLGLTTFSIIRHHLFDIRAAVARSLAYVMSLGFIGLAYGALIFLLSFTLLVHSHIDALERTFYIGLALISAIIFQPVQRFFNKTSNRLFYQDAYDQQSFLNQLNEAFVSNIELGILLRHTTRVIEDNISCEFCLIGVSKTDTQPWRVMGMGEHSFNEADSQLMRSELANMGKKLILTDDLESHESKLKRLLQKNNVSAVASLVNNYKVQGDATAYLILGPKKSGNIYGKRDLRMLEIIANELLIAIQNALRFEEIENFNATLQQKIRAATRQLQGANEKLRALDEAKDDFISMASHQLRTPLTSIKGYTSMVLEGDAGKITATQEKLLRQSFVSAQRMVYLIADLLNVSRLRTGKFMIEARPVDLVEVVAQELEQLRDTATSRSLTLAFEKPNHFPEMLLDETKTRQVIMNFVDNAIYYTPAGGTITVELLDKPASIELRVTDEGIGVPKSEQPHLFTKFYRAVNARKARPDGTGLGLFMAKKVIIAQGGALIFHSEEGIGSTFGFTLSKSKLAKPVDNP